MKKYTSPDVELLAFLAKDAIMSSNENESERDNFFAEDIQDITTI